MLNTVHLDYPKWFSLNIEQGDVVRKIAEEYPYSIEVVSGIYMEQKFSEDKTREVLTRKMTGPTNPWAVK